MHTSGDHLDVRLVVLEHQHAVPQGKLLAMEYARQKLGFSHDATVAAGDSGEQLL